ncbi:aspartate 1-decarboxylase autocleavage activator PanM [Pseudomonas sp. SWRI92]|nr:aspartate 1-decarboxylase autocleavage activator PanM [Pseudomonas sp. SWRI92]
MPIVVEHLNDATGQDQQDLQKIYQDAPTWLLEPFCDAAQLISVCLAEGSLIAARFNDRLLGAARLQRHQDAWHLSQMCVRKITRRRGVAERLVSEALRMARHDHVELRLSAPAGHLEAQALAAKLKLPLDVGQPGLCPASLRQDRSPNAPSTRDVILPGKI